MKIKITIIVLFTITNIGNISCQYLPMVQENKFWIYQRYYESDSYPVATGFLINFEGDTILNSTNYKKVWQQGLSGTHPCPMGFMPCFVFDQPYHIMSKYLIGFIREDTIDRKVYYKPKEWLYCNVDEYLLFDFSLQVNDELDDCKKEALGDQPGFGIIDSITYEQFWGDIRKVFHTTGFTSLIGDASEGQVNIFEGFGFEKYGLFLADALIEIYDYCEGSFSDCNIISSSTDPAKKEEISFYPNPTMGEVRISAGQLINVVDITDLQGRTLLTFAAHEKEVVINISELPVGMYFIRIMMGNDTWIKKIIKK